MKKFLTLLMLFVAAIPLCAEDFTVDGIYYNITDETNKTVEVTYRGSYYDSYDNEYTGSVVIPESVTYDGTTYNVTAIGDDAFTNCTGLTSVTIPNSVTSIGSSAFYGTPYYNNMPDGVIYINNILYNYKGTMPANTTIEVREGTVSISGSAFNYCRGLTSITIPESVTSIGSSAFYYCTGLTEITIPNSVTSIGDGAFFYCSGLTEITIPNSVTSIGDYAFAYCWRLTSITIPESVTSIGDFAFRNCEGLTSVTIPNSVTEIGEMAFFDCRGLTSITIPNSVTSIGERAFEGCTGLTSVTIGGSVTSIGDYAFSSCSGLTSITIPESVTSIGDFAFWNCEGLTSVTIPNSVTSIGDCAFEDCKGLTSVTIPESVISIGERAFSGCSGLTELVVEEGNTVYDSRDNCNAIIETATNTLIQGCNNAIIPNSVTSIGDYAFYNCTGLTSITIPNSVTSIGKYAFYECTGLTSITIPNSVTSIGNYAFSFCEGLTSITIPESVTEIGSRAFDGTPYYNNMPDGVVYINNVLYKYKGTMPANTTIEVREGTVSISSNAFYGCSGLTEITIPNSVTSIGDMAFYGCTGLTEIVVDAENRVYDSRDNCNAIIETSTNTLIAGCKNTIIPSSVTSIGDNAFSGCTGLTSVTIPNSVTSIGYGAFQVCTGLTSITIPEGVTSIGDGAFHYCSGLTSITIPGSVTEIGDLAFYECTSLTEITCLATTPPTIGGSYTFYNVPKSIPVYVPAVSVEAYKAADYWNEFTNIVALEAPVSSMVIDDTNSTFTNAGDLLLDTLTYIRNFEDTEWQTWYVPFEVDYNTLAPNFAVARINNVHQYDNNEDGIIDLTVMEAIMVKEGTLKANYPYLVKAHTADEYEIVVENAMLLATIENSIDCASVSHRFVCTGTYNSISAETAVANNYYALSGVLFTPEVTEGIGAFRWYMTVENRDNQPTPTRVELRVEENLTDIEGVEQDAPGEVEYYDLSGRRIEHPTRGIYIMKQGNTVKKVVM